MLYSYPTYIISLSKPNGGEVTSSESQLFVDVLMTELQVPLERISLTEFKIQHFKIVNADGKFQKVAKWFPRLIVSVETHL